MDRGPTPAPSFDLDGRRYAAALFPDNTTYVLPPGAIPGLPSRRAKPGDTIVLYGVGFGSVTPNIPAGQVVQQSNTLALPVQIFFGQTRATTVAFAGLAPAPSADPLLKADKAGTKRRRQHQ